MTGLAVRVFVSLVAFYGRQRERSVLQTHQSPHIGTTVTITPRKTATKRKSPDKTPAMSAKAPPVALAKEWQGQDPSVMLMSEKLDGMRCFWDGENMFTQNGNVISAPVAIVRSLPPTALDGELASSVVVDFKSTRGKSQRGGRKKPRVIGNGCATCYHRSRSSYENGLTSPDTQPPVLHPWEEPQTFWQQDDLWRSRLSASFCSRPRTSSSRTSTA